MAIILPILSTFNAAGVKSAQNSLTGLGGTLATLGKRVAAAAVGFQGLQGVINFAGDSISQARDLERNMSALSTVFGDLTPRMTEFVKNANSMGLSQTDAARTATYLGSVLKQAGFGMEDVAADTERLTVLAQDLATTFGYDTQVALSAMTAMFRGEYDPIEKFGVALKQNEVNALVLDKGLGHLTGTAMLYAQQQVRMEQLFLRSADASGAFARQSGTLFVEQKKLTASFEDMQAVLGTALLPSIVGLMTALTPIIEEQTPGLEDAFQVIGKVIEDLTPIIKPVISILGSIVGVFTKVMKVLEPIIELFGAGLAVALELVADLLGKLDSVLGQVLGYLGGLFETLNKDYGGSKFFKFINDFVAQSTILKPFFEIFMKVGNRVAEIMSSNDNNRSFRGDAARYGAMQDFYARKFAFETAAAEQEREQPKGTTPTDYVKEFYAELKDEVEKQASRLRLANLGASQAFIESIVGSGQDWKKVFASVAARGKEGVARLQREFNKTSAGLKEIAQANEEAIKAAQDAYDEAFKAYEKQLEVYDKQVEAINALKKSLTELVSGVAPLAIVTREIGQFEQATIESFDNIAEAIMEGVADGTLLKDAAQSLIDYARKEQAVIADLMRQRDDIAKRRSLAQAMLSDVKSAIVGMGNITEILGKTSADVTQTITKMVGGIQVATSKVVKGATGGASELIASFTETLNKTKQFAQQLKDLRALGLDKNLYQQIVSAGIDAGGATAKAILEGGTGTVSELNNLFAELDAVGGDIAEQSAQVMYGAGIDLVDGLLNGLMSKEKELVDYATKLANAFTTAFTDRMNFAMPMPTAPIPPAFAGISQTMSVNSALLDTFALARDLAGSASEYYSGSESIRFAQIAQRQQVPINITVNAGMGTDGKIVGQTIQSYINQYNKANSSF